MKRIKKIRATMFDDAFEVWIEPLAEAGLPYSKDVAVYLDGEKIGFITPHETRSERKIPGSRLVRRGATFTAWADRELHDESFDYYHQHRSQSEAIRHLVHNVQSSRRRR